MSEDDRFAPKAPPHWTAPEEAPTPSGVRSRPQETALNRFLGGSPGGVFLRLLFVSLIVGAFLMWLDIRPWDIFRGLKQLVDRIGAWGSMRSARSPIISSREPRSSFRSGWCCGS